MSRRFAIFNADDFGYSRGINRGIVHAHREGVVTSATLVVNGSATAGRGAPRPRELSG